MEQIEHYTKYEMARMIGSRALQISMGAPSLIKMTDEELTKIGYDTVKLAGMEYDRGIIPITVRRQMPKQG